MNDFALNFDRMNEADVREEFIAPLLAGLGYRSGSENHAAREVPLSLRYPRSSLGRKNAKADPYLRGRADYVLEVSGHARWVIEAKPPHESIDVDSIEQAWSYASHPEVRAVYFAISNGREFRIYRTSAPPESPPILQMKYEDIARDSAPISKLLSADAIRRDFPIEQDVGVPLGPGLRSLAMIASGSISYSRISTPMPIIEELQIAIVDGAIERGEAGSLIAYVVTLAPIKSIQQMIEKMGLSKLEYTSTSTVLSSDPEFPTEFSYNGQAIFQKGEELFDMTSNTRVKLPCSINCDVRSRAQVHVKNGGIVGSIENFVAYSGGINRQIVFSGDIALRVV